MLLFLALLAQMCWTGGGGAATAVVRCVDRDDYNALLYRICTHSVLCSRLYYLDHASTNLSARSASAATAALSTRRGARDFQKFVQQVRIDLSVLMLDTLPDAWVPHALPRATDFAEADGGAMAATALNTVSCSQSFNLSARENAPLVLSALLALNTYGMLRPENVCADRNQRLHLMPDNTMVCMCAPGYSCSNEATFSNILTVLLIIFILAIAIWTMAIFYAIFAMSDRLRIALGPLTTTTAV